MDDPIQLDLKSLMTMPKEVYEMTELPIVHAKTLSPMKRKKSFKNHSSYASKVNKSLKITH